DRHCSGALRGEERGRRAARCGCTLPVLAEGQGRTEDARRDGPRRMAGLRPGRRAAVPGRSQPGDRGTDALLHDRLGHHLVAPTAVGAGGRLHAATGTTGLVRGSSFVRSSLRRTASAVAAIAVLLVWVVALRPQRLGGTTEYLAVRGVSMLPTMHNGDLVVVERQSSYRLPEILA